MIPAPRRAASLPEAESPDPRDELSSCKATDLELGIGIILKAEEEGHPPELADWLARNPALAFDLADFLASQRGIQSAARELHGLPAIRVEEAANARPVVGGFELKEEVGRGGMGVVYRAFDPALKRWVAVKRILAGPFTTQNEKAHFRFEAEAAAGLDHPAVVPIHAFGEEGGHPYLVMVWMERGNLAERLGQTGQKTTPRGAAILIRDVALGVNHAHLRGLLHRDLKPGNILFDQDNRPHIADFGLAVSLEASFCLSLRNTMAGTAAYMAPEQVSGRKSLTTAVDIHALGAILYELLTGSPPFGNSEWLVTLQRVRDDAATPFRDLHGDVPVDLETVCLRCLEKNPEDRYPSAQDLVADLNRFLEGEPLGSKRPGWLVAFGRALSRRRETLSLSTWPGCFGGAAVVLVTNGIVAWAVWAEVSGLWAYAALGANLAGWLALYAWFLIARIHLLSMVERLSAGIQFGAIVACLSLLPAHVQRHGMDILSLYPALTTVLALGIFAHGATHWGKLYLAGIFLMGVSALLPVLPRPYWPIAHGLAIGGLLIWTGFRLRAFDLEGKPDRLENLPG